LEKIPEGEKMKQDYTKFVCDECEKLTEVMKNAGYPYQDGWCYIFNFETKFLRLYTPGIEIDVARLELKDKHFCSLDCMFKHIKKKIAEAKKIEKVSHEEIAKAIKVKK
jgi:hypothetical protein